MKKKILVGVGLAVGLVAGAFISPINAQQNSVDPQSCRVGEASNAACIGKWILFAGNTSGVDSGAWAIRMNGETGEVWYKNGKRMVLVEEPN